MGPGCFAHPIPSRLRLDLLTIEGLDSPGNWSVTPDLGVEAIDFLGCMLLKNSFYK